MPEAIFCHGCHRNTEIHIHTKFHFHTLHGLPVREVKKWEKCLRPFFVHGRHGNTETHMLTKIVCKFEELKSSYRKKCLRPLLFTVVTETLKYTCVSSFTSMHCMMCKFEKGKSCYRKKCLRPFFVNGCHENAQIDTSLSSMQSMVCKVEK